MLGWWFEPHKGLSINSLQMLIGLLAKPRLICPNFAGKTSSSLSNVGRENKQANMQIDSK